MIDPAIPPLVDDALAQIQHVSGNRYACLADAVDDPCVTGAARARLGVLIQAEHALTGRGAGPTVRQAQLAHAGFCRALRPKPKTTSVPREHFGIGMAWRLGLIAGLVVLFIWHQGQGGGMV